MGRSTLQGSAFLRKGQRDCQGVFAADPEPESQGQYRESRQVSLSSVSGWQQPSEAQAQQWPSWGNRCIGLCVWRLEKCRLMATKDEIASLFPFLLVIFQVLRQTFSYQGFLLK